MGAVVGAVVGAVGGSMNSPHEFAMAFGRPQWFPMLIVGEAAIDAL